MKKITSFFNAVLMLTLSLPAFSTPINLNDFFYDPAVTISADGLSAVMQEDITFPATLLVNDPFLGDPEVIFAGINSKLILDFSFNEGASNDDELRIFLFDADSTNILNEFYSDESIAKTLTFDLSAYIGLTLGFQIELSSFDNFYDSIINVSSLTLSTVQPPQVAVPEPTSIAMFFGALLLIALSRSKSSTIF